MDIFFDRNAGRRIPQALALLDPPFGVKAHDDYLGTTSSPSWCTVSSIRFPW